MRWRIILTSALSAVVISSGCSSENAPDDSSTESISTGDPTATESGSESETTAEGPPPMPPEAEQDGEAGAVAFVEHWVELVNYAITTGDVEPAEGVTSVACDVCEAIHEAISEVGGPDATGEWSLSEVEVRGPRRIDPEAVDYVVTADVHIAGEGSGEIGTITAGVLTSPSGRRIQWLRAE